MKYLILGFFIFVIVFQKPTHVECSVLFKNYSYGMSEQDVRHSSGALKCDDEELSDCLCTPNPVSFANSQWQQIFSFDNNKLIAVSLVAEVDDNSYLSTIQAIAENGYTAAYVDTPIGSLDVLELTNTVEKKQTKNMLLEFEKSALSMGEISITFLPSNYFQNSIKSKTGDSSLMLITNAPPQMRMITIQVEDEYISVTFTMPTALREKIILEGKKQKEKF